MRQYLLLLTRLGVTGNAIPLLRQHRVDDPIAWRKGGFISTGSLLGHAQTLAQHLPQQPYVLNLCRDRYHFAVAFLAAIIARKVSLLPPSLAPAALNELCADYGDVCCVADHSDVPQGVIAVNIEDCDRFEAANAIPHVEEDRIVAILFTSGSTGRPTAHEKSWGALVQGALALDSQIDFTSDARRVVLGSVPPQHMFGLETTVMLPLQCGGIIHAGWPLLPSDIHAAANLPRPCWLMTTPLQLRACAEQANDDAPRFAGIISSTMPLSENLAARIEARYHCAVHEIYGCTEIGMIATRRTTHGTAWTLASGLRLRIDGERATVDGGHAQRPHCLDDRLDVVAPGAFTLIGRASDLVKIGGKRTSLEGLNHTLRETPGVKDAVFFIPTQHGDKPVRPIAFAIAPGCTQDEILRHLRQRLDPVFLPRPLHLVEVLPRTATGKISSVGLAALTQTLTSALSAST